MPHTRREFLRSATFLPLTAGVAGSINRSERTNILTAEDALARLKEGNQRFAAGQVRHGLGRCAARQEEGEGDGEDRYETEQRTKHRELFFACAAMGAAAVGAQTLTHRCAVLAGEQALTWSSLTGCLTSPSPADREVGRTSAAMREVRKTG